MSSVSKGRVGEDIVADFFVQRGFVVVKRNVRFKFGEIDLLVRKDAQLVLVEVKMLGRSNCGNEPELAITPRKLMHMRMCLVAIQQQNPTLTCSYDCVSVVGRKITNHLQNIELA